MENIIIDGNVGSSNCQFAIRTSLGGRSEQQDFAGVFLDENMFVAVVCDGMGGGDSGKLASEIAVRTVHKMVSEYSGAEEKSEFLLNILKETNRTVFERLNGVGGSTIVLSLIQDGYLFWASAGDSRLYIIRAGEMLQVTRDHNYRLRLNELLSRDKITSQKFEKEIIRGDALISFIGIDDLSLFDLTENGFALLPGDKMLLTTDGFFNTVPHERIADILNSDASLSEQADNLLSELNQRVKIDCQDNSTFIIIYISR